MDDINQVPDSFQAFRIHNDSDGYRSGVENISLDDLSAGDVTIRVGWSGINYTDALAASARRRGGDLVSGPPVGDP